MQFKLSGLVVLITFLCLSTRSFCQEERTLSGILSNSKTGENLIGATVYDTVSKRGVITNEYGFYSLSIPNQDAVLKISYFGLGTQFIRVPVGQDEFSLQLAPMQEINEVSVSAEGLKRSVESTNIGTMELSMEKVDKLPVLLGEKDVLRILQLMPGVASGGEGSTGIYVRGGGPDQNLILLDGVPVYNVSHLFGFFSVFNSDAISKVTLTKGGFPARYGGRVSSVLDMRMKEGNMKEYNVEGSVGLIASRILVEGPIKKDKTAFTISARRTYLDILSIPVQKIINPDQGLGGYFFYDVNAKIHHKFNEKHHIYISSYAGRDKAYFTNKGTTLSDDNEINYKSQESLHWGNAIGAVRWNYRIRPKLFLNTTASYSQYRFELGQRYEESYTDQGTPVVNQSGQRYFSGIRDWTGKTDFTYILNTNNNIKFGGGNTYHTFTPGAQAFNSSVENQVFDTVINPNTVNANEAWLYIENDQQVTKRLKVNYGLHHASFFVNNESYHRLQPRLSANYILTENSSVKLGASRTAQFLHLLTNQGLGLPTDLWIPATERIPPVTSNQISLGYNYEWNRAYNFTVEGYYKKMNNLVQYKEGANFMSTDDDWQDKVTMGQGWSYGAEILLERKKGRFTGWIGYTLSWTQRQFEELNAGEPFYYKYDRRHDLSITGTMDLNDKWDFGVVFVYSSGMAMTLATQNYYSKSDQLLNPLQYNQSNKVGNFEKINDYRMPSYHRMDIGFNRTKQKKWGTGILSLSVYNAYNRQNAFFLFVKTDETGEKRLMQQALFPIVPSISYKFKIDFEKVNKNRQDHE
jgi:hypothetical protein